MADSIGVNEGPRRLDRVPTAPYAATSSASAPAPARFSLHAAASFISKDSWIAKKADVFQFCPYNRVQPQPQRKRRRSQRPDSGHDAFFISRVGDSGALSLGVADGVGGWADWGIDPADFSHGICDHMANAAYQYHRSAGPFPTAKRLIQAGYDAVRADPAVEMGSSTACVAIATPGGDLEVANLGDSGFLHVRLNAIIAHSEPQTHGFNAPFQLARLTPQLEALQSNAFGGGQINDRPDSAAVSHHSLRHGDVFILATDGLLDNLFNHDILGTVKKVMLSRGAWEMTQSRRVGVASGIEALVDPPHPTDRPNLQGELAKALTDAARAASLDRRVDGPWAKKSQKEYRQNPYQGGKPDDITVVVAVACEEPADTGRREPQGPSCQP